MDIAITICACAPRRVHYCAAHLYGCSDDLYTDQTQTCIKCSSSSHDFKFKQKYTYNRAGNAALPAAFQHQGRGTCRQV